MRLRTRSLAVAALTSRRRSGAPASEPRPQGSGFLLLTALALTATLASAEDWTGWGGPNGDFTLDSAPGLAAKWPAGGPPIVWSRALGSGYSAISVEDGVLYTMYRGVNRSDEHDVFDSEFIVALDGASGKTLWEFEYPAPNEARAKGPRGPGPREFIRETRGQPLYLGPNATPLVYDGMVYAIGGTAKMHALDKETGKLVWSSDFFEEFGALSDIRGRSPSPIEYAGKIIMVVGGAAGLVMAFDPKTGDISHATPIVANVHGEDQLIFTTEQFVIGLAAKTGEARWEFPHPSRERVSIPNVLWLDDTYVFASGINLNPKQLLKITREGDDFTAEEVWTQTNEIKTYQTPGLRFGEYVYMGSETIFYCFKWKTGEMVWRLRGYPHAYLLQAQDKTILLDGEGQMSLVNLSAEGVEVISQFQLFEERSWTNPTLVGTTLYARSKRDIKAVDLSAK